MRNLRTLFLAAGLCVAASAIDARPAAAQATITCESHNNQFKDCGVQTGGKVRLQQNISNTRCEYGRTWGFDWNSVWVDRGWEIPGERLGHRVGVGQLWAAGDLREPERLVQDLRSIDLWLRQVAETDLAVALCRGTHLGLPAEPDLGGQRLSRGVRSRVRRLALGW